MCRPLLAVATFLLATSSALAQDAYLSTRVWNGDKFTTYSGSGTLIDVDRARRGIILTAWHTLDHGPGPVTVKLEGFEYAATILDADEEVDLAAVQIRNAPDVCVSVNPYVDRGASVWATGFGRRESVGVLPTKIVGKTENEEIVIDVNLGQGSSGGAVYDENGELCGVIVRRSKRNERTAAVSGKPLRQFLQRVLGDRGNERVAFQDMRGVKDVPPTLPAKEPSRFWDFLYW